ncbi:MAG: hypothetical protein WBN32_05870 [Woeseia sp.]
MKRKKSQPMSPANPTLLAASGACILMANPAAAVELAEIQVQSALGQPLRASVAFALAPHEQLNDECVYLNAAANGQGLPVVSRASATVSGQNILLRGDIPLREPMMTLQLAVNCAYTAKVSREYLLLLSPASATENVSAATSAPQATAENAVRSAPAADQRRPVNTYTAPARTTPASARAAEPVAAGSEYRVRVGDTLSEIASRIPERKVGLWNAVDRIFDANPGAFIDNDINRLIAGTTLQIPSSVTSGSRAVSAAVPQRTPAVSRTPNTRAYNGVAESQAPAPVVDTMPAPQTAAAEPATPAVVPVAQSPQAVEPAATQNPDVEATPDNAAAASAVDIAVESSAATQEPFVATPAPAPQATVSIPDTRIEQQQPVPVVAADNETGASSWLVWLGGTGIVIFLALLLFGRRLREKFEDAQYPDADLDETQVSNISHVTPAALTETIGRANALQVSEDLSNNAVFDTGDDLDVALDYSFASSGDHSKDLDFIVEGDEPDNKELPTRVMPAAAEAAATDDDYDMSMVLDVTKQDFQSPRMAVDLQATATNLEQSAKLKTRARDLTTEFDYRILEQDYEDELTATQALSREVEIAARDLQKRLGDAESDTAETSMAQDIEATAEITAEMPYRALGQDSEDTEETLSLTPSEETDLTEALAASMDELDFDIDDDDETAVLNLDDTAAKQRRSKAG